MEQTLAWTKRIEPFGLRFGRYTIKTVRIPSLSLQTPCTELASDIAATFADAPPLPDDCEAITLPAYPIEARPARLSGFFGSAITYVSKSEPRYLVPLRGTFQDYVSGFSGRRRKLLTGEIRKLTEFAGGHLELRIFAHPDELKTFRAVAAAMSERGYKRKLGTTFADANVAPDEPARGYVLYCRGEAMAYVLCREQGTNLLYAHTGYEAKWAKLSPGTVLLWLILQSLFAEQRFEYLDLMWGFYPYKAVFGRTSLRVACVYRFRGTLRNRALILTHLTLTMLTKWMRALTSRLRVGGVAEKLGEKLIRRP